MSDETKASPPPGQLSEEELETLVELLGRLPGGAGGTGEACSP